MRFEINVPDTTSRELKARLAKLTKRLSKNPKLVKEIPLDEDEEIQRLFTPEVMAQIRKADAEISAGKFLTQEELNERLAKHKAKWLRENKR